VTLTLKMTATEAIYCLVSTPSVIISQSMIGLINTLSIDFIFLELELQT
jgi:hypothetical protein